MKTFLITDNFYATCFYKIESLAETILVSQVSTTKLKIMLQFHFRQVHFIIIIAFEGKPLIEKLAYLFNLSIFV